MWLCMAVMKGSQSTREAHDGMLASNMESGLNEGYDRLDEVLRTLH